MPCRMHLDQPIQEREHEKQHEKNRNNKQGSPGVECQSTTMHRLAVMCRHSTAHVCKRALCRQPAGEGGGKGGGRCMAPLYPTWLLCGHHVRQPAKLSLGGFVVLARLTRNPAGCVAFWVVGYPAGADVQQSTSLPPEGGKLSA